MQVSRYQLSLDEMRFFARHGCTDEEQQVGGTFLVSLTMTLERVDAVYSDDLRQTVDYAAVYALVRAAMQQSCRLIEHIAPSIAEQLFAEYDYLEAVTIRISKLHPPIEHAVMKSASAELHFTR
jgi:dihydroneopterin aldolase